MRFLARVVGVGGEELAVRDSVRAEKKVVVRYIARDFENYIEDIRDVGCRSYRMNGFDDSCYGLEGRLTFIHRKIIALGYGRQGRGRRT